MSFDRLIKSSTLATIALTVLCVGCGYGEVSPAAYEHSKSLYTVSNLRSSDSVERVAEAIARDLEAGKLSESEAGWLTDICDDCRAARWREAQDAARRIMQDQVRS